MSKDNLDQNLEPVMFNFSPSLLNNYLWVKKYYNTDKKEEYLKQHRDMLEGIFVSNHYIETGKLFEDLVYAKKAHNEVYEHIKREDGYIYQRWFNRQLKITDDIYAYFSGKFDAVNLDTGVIKDLKRTTPREDHFRKQNYSDTDTVQHLIYMYVLPKSKSFEYVICEAETTENVVESATRPVDIHIIKHEKPTEKELEEKLRSLVLEYLHFLTDNGLDEIFMSKKISKVKIKKENLWTKTKEETRLD